MAVDLAEPQRPPRTWLLPGPLSCPPIALAGGLAAPSEVGQVFLLEPSSGKSLGEPFQPRCAGRRCPAARTRRHGRQGVCARGWTRTALSAANRRQAGAALGSGGRDGVEGRHRFAAGAGGDAGLRRRRRRPTRLLQAARTDPGRATRESTAVARGGLVASASACCWRPTAASCTASTCHASRSGKRPWPRVQWPAFLPRRRTAISSLMLPAWFADWPRRPAGNWEE